MPEEKLTRAEWERVCAIEKLTEQIKSVDVEIDELGDRAAQEIQKLEDWKVTLTGKIKTLGG